MPAQLAEAQDHCVELAANTGELHAEIRALRLQLLLVERDRDAWRGPAYGTAWVLTG